MSAYSIWPYFIVIAVVLALFSTPIFRFVDPLSFESKERVSTLDGIRGFLALSVMIDHAVVTYRWLKTGAWIVPPAPFYDQLGTLSVAVFFMITGFLFWGKMIQSDGSPRLIKIYINRIFRIAPIYLLAIAAMTVIVLHRTGFKLHQPLADFLSAIANWAALGLLGGPDFNGYQNAWIILAGVTWTLKYEWFFYFSLAITGWFARGNFKIVVPACGLIVSLLGAQIFSQRDWYLAALFCVGMLAATTKGTRVDRGGFDVLRSSIAVLLLAVVFAVWSTPFGTVQILLLAVFFYLICNGTSIFGLLRTRAAQRLGHISYSVYLLQGIVMTLIFPRPTIRALSLNSAGAFWIVVGACAVILAVVSSITYVLIEQPGIRMGRRLSKRRVTDTRVTSAA